MLSTILRQGLSKLHLEIDDSQQQQLLNYVELLHKWNKAYNLTGKCTQEQLLTRHILDCLSIARYLDIDNLDTDNILDIGTGAGLPGIPLAIVYPDKKFTLIDSNGKKIRFLLQTLHQLAIHNTQALETNIRDFQPIALFDIILSRALASLSDIATLSQPLLARDGKILAMKGKYPQSELATVSNWHSEVIPTTNLCDTGARHLVIMHQNIREIVNKNI